MPARLTEAQVAQYHDEGLVIPDWRLPDDVLQRLRDNYDSLLEANRKAPGASEDFMVGVHIADPGPMGVQGVPDLLEVIRLPDILEMVSQVAGPNLILWGTTVFGKPAGTGKATPWHQDGDYYPIEPLETTTVWVSLDHTRPENGCMRYIPGSHRDRKLYPHHWNEDPGFTLYQEIDPEFAPEGQARDIVLEPGQISIHDVYLVHGSSANTSSERRAGLVFRIMPGTSHYNHARGGASENPSHDYSRRPLFLLSGQDRTGKNDFAIGH
ncbi:MAG: phytanoyl-CoA dioxygenase [Rhodospirillaceae bacterium]|nr:phytanoyl-CoA dioxygenase [Rhodospirillaceae bacterium]|tara:strand:+ start:4351 stop:5154 length:804 start_codon:yes stop_codon:yes gene_type:complete